MSNFNIDTGGKDSIYQPGPNDPASGAHGIAEIDDTIITDLEATEAGVIDLANRVGAVAWSAALPVKQRQLLRGTNGALVQCKTAGTTGATEPAWPTTQGSTVTDGTVTWLLLVPGTGAFVGVGQVTTHTPAEGQGGGPGLQATFIGVDEPLLITGQGVAYQSGSPTVTDAGGTAYTLGSEYVAVPFTIPSGDTYIGQVALAITTASTTPDANTYLTAGIWTNSSGKPGTNLTASAGTAVPSLYADQLSNPSNNGAVMPITNGSLATPYFIRTTGLAAGNYFLVLKTNGVASTFKVGATASGSGAVTVQTSADGATWAAGTSESLSVAIFDASQPGGMFHSNGYVGLRGDSGSSYGGTMEGAGGYYGVYGTGGAAGVYGHSHGNVGVQGSSVHGPGVFGSTQSLAADSPGVYGTGPTGVQGDSSNSGYQGVLGNGSSGAAGVMGSSSGAGIGVHGKSTAASGAGSAVKGEVTASSAYAGEFRSYSGSAGFFRKTDSTGSAASVVIAQGDTSLQSSGGYLYEAQDDTGATLGGIWSDGSIKLAGPNAVLAFRSNAVVTTATAGTATLPANPSGFIIVYVGTTAYKMPVYAN